MPNEPMSENVAYRGARFKIVKREFHNRHDPSQPMKREVVVPANAVVVLPVLDSTPGREKVVLIRNERPAVGETLWELPAGTIEEGEDPKVCAERELIEETGYEAERVAKLGDFYSCPGFCTELLTAYVAEGLTEVGQDLDDTEQIEVHVTPLSEALEMVRDNRIRDAKSIAALLQWATFREGAGKKGGR